MAKYKKKRARELKHDRFRDTTMLLADRLAERAAGRGRQILYGLAAIVIIAAAAYGIVRWRHKHADDPHGIFIRNRPHHPDGPPILNRERCGDRYSR